MLKSVPMGEIEASIRIWSIKEAVTKALGIKLTEAWKKVEVKEIGIDISRIEIDGKPEKSSTLL